MKSTALMLALHHQCLRIEEFLLSLCTSSSHSCPDCDILLQVGDIPKFIVEWINYSKNLKVLDMPSYDYLQSLIPKPSEEPKSGKKRKASAHLALESQEVNACKKLRDLEPEE